MLKGAAGAGLPILAVPAIAAFYDVRVAVVLLVIPNFFTNIWQIIKFKEHDLPNKVAPHFALAGFIGAGIGTLLLAYLPLVALKALIVSVVFSYIVIRIRQPEFKLSMRMMQRWVFVAGSSAGILQGAIGLSSPITITFLHAARLPRLTFIYIASLFFASLSVMQVPLQSVLGLMNWELALISLLALIPIAIGMPVGNHIGKKLSPALFDRIILILLAFLALKMLFDVSSMLHFTMANP